MKKILFCFFTFYSFLQSPGQGFQDFCGIDIHPERMNDLSPEYKDKYFELFRESPWVLDEAKQNGVLTIPVAVHVVYNSPSENITDGQIQSGIQILNQDFRRQNADASQTAANAYYVYQDVSGYHVGYASYTGLAADVGIEFCLVGITRTYTSYTYFTPSSTSYNYGTDVKAVKDIAPAYNYYPPDKYLNIWVCSLQGPSGYSTFPGQAPVQYDGITVANWAFGETGLSSSMFKRIITHEVGHWLGLFHIWGNSGICDTDYVNDTYPHETQNNYSNTSPNNTAINWGLNDNSQCFDWFNCNFNYNLPYVGMNDNYMDYAPGYCSNFFSLGQANRIWYHIQNYRSNLGSAGCGPVSIDPLNSVDSQISLFLNAEQNLLEIRSENGIPGNFSISILSLEGKEVKHMEEMKTLPPFQKIKIDLAGISSGVYILRIYGRKSSINQKFIVP